MQKSKTAASAEQQLARFNPQFVQTATIMDNRDPEKMGRVKVWINGSQSDRNAKDSWVTCRYATPFGGRTPGQSNSTAYDTQTKSYGLWAVPPDIGVTVLVFFANGNIHDAYWFGCVFDHGMNSMVPGMAVGNLDGTELEDSLPVTDYDRKTVSKGKKDQYLNVPLIEGLKKQNLLYDQTYGPKDHSAGRQSPSMVYGLSTPRGQQIILDDGYSDSELSAGTWDSDPDTYQDTQINHPANDTKIGSRKNEGVGLRTRSGAQVWLSEETGNIFIINRDGTCRIELSNEGNITVLADKSISYRAGEDFNIHVGRDFNYEVMGNMNGFVKGVTKEEFTGKHNTVHHADTTVNCDTNIRTFASDTIRFESSTTMHLSSVSDMHLTSNAIMHLKGAAKVNLTGGASVVTFDSHVGSSTEFRAPNFKAPGIGLVGHKHNHKVWVGANNHSNDMDPGYDDGASANTNQSISATPASDVLAEKPTLVTHQQTVSVSTTGYVSNKLNSDLSGGSSAPTVERLALVMPCNGTVCKPNGDDNTGWTIKPSGDLVASEQGTVSTPAKGIITIDHGNGYTSVYKGIKTKYVAKRDLVTKGQAIGTGSDKIQFEIRRTGSGIYGKAGNVDPGSFYQTVTGVGQNANNASLSAGVSSITNAPTTVVSENSDELVTTAGVQSITSNFVSRGPIRKPLRRVKKPTKPTNVYRTSTLAPPSVINGTAIDWKVTGDESKLIEDFKFFEGSMAYQATHGTYYDDKFHQYNDWVAAGERIIGYGHLVLPSEDFRGGITEAFADQILVQDSRIAAGQAKAIASSYNMKIPVDAQMILTEMVFQMGPGKVKAFRKFLKALANNDYALAANEMRESVWYLQTTKRAEYLAQWMTQLA